MTTQIRVASGSFADDITLVARALDALTRLVQGFQDWCQLLGLTINISKTQLWCNKKATPVTLPVVIPLRDGPLRLTPRPTFGIVGIELGENELSTSAAHFEPRMAAAL